ncbi:MAG: ABC transporter permease [Oscillospiraceae bacterium]|nr:ABC transporter permease [Oscillospiraceae bacterium]
MKNRTVLPNIYLGLLLALMYLPIAIVIIYSFNASRVNAVWDGFTLSWYKELFRDRAMFEALRNSLILAALSSLAAAVIGTLGAFGMSRSNLKTGKVLEYISMMPIMVPEIILGMVFLAFFSLLGLPFGMLTLMIAHTSFSIPYVYLIVKSRLAGLNKSYEEAARDLGANSAQVLRDIIFPLVLPGILSGVLLSLAMSFDDVIISVFITGVNTNTLPIKIYSQIKTGVTPKTNALCTLLFAATIALELAAAWISRLRASRET